MRVRSASWLLLGGAVPGGALFGPQETSRQAQCGDRTGGGGWALEEPGLGCPREEGGKALGKAASPPVPRRMLSPGITAGAADLEDGPRTRPTGLAMFGRQAVL